MKNISWYKVSNPSNLISPSLLVYPERIEKNIEQMIAMVDDIQQLRPHIKTHKTLEIVKMQMEHGIVKFKCSTIAEAEMLGTCGAQEILLAMPLVGPNIKRFIQLIKTFPRSNFSSLVDCIELLDQIAAYALNEKIKVSLWMDINVGMNRTGVISGVNAIALYQQMELNPVITAKGFHVYDGHIHFTNLNHQQKEVDLAFKSILDLKAAIEQKGMNVNTIIAGGSPSFPIHAKRKTVEVAPGTTVLWDAGYTSLFPHLNFIPSAVLFTRIISKPAPGILCFDLGHKSVAPEMSLPRVQFLNLPDSEQISQSEEHLVVRVKDANKYSVGDSFYALPMHVCPTVAKYEYLQVVTNGKIINQWQVLARNQRITI